MHASWSRSVYKHRSLPEANITNAQCQFLSLLNQSRSTTDTMPLVELHWRLRSWDPTENPTRHFFDAFRTNIVAPDHCLFGKIRNMWAAFYLSLASNAVRRTVNQVIAFNMKANSMPYDANVFNASDKSLNSTSFSLTYSVLSVFIPSMLQYVAQAPSMSTEKMISWNF